MANDTDLIIRLRSDIKRLEEDLNKTKSRLRGFQGFTKGFASQMTSYFGAAFGFFAATNFVRNSIEKIAAFEYQMDKVAAVSRASSEEVGKLQKNALDLGASTKFTATEIGKMQEEIARLGFSTPKILDTTDAIRKLATVADAELGESAKVMVKTLNAFNLEAKESERVANVMAESFSMSALDLETFSVGMAYAATAGKTFGLEVEQVTAMLGTLVDSGIQAQKAGTGLRDIFTDLSVKGISLQEAYDMVNSSANKTSTAFDLVGKTSMNQLIILAEQQDKTTKLTEAFADQNRELNSMVKIMEDNLLTDWKLFTSALDGLIQKGGALNSFFRGSVQGMTDFVVAVQNIDLVVSALGKGIEDFSRNDIFRLVDAGMITESGERVKDLVKQIQSLEGLNLNQLRVEFVKLFKDQGESIEDINVLWDAYFNNAPLIKESNKRLSSTMSEVSVEMKKFSNELDSALSQTPDLEMGISSLTVSSEELASILGAELKEGVKDVSDQVEILNGNLLITSEQFEKIKDKNLLDVFETSLPSLEKFSNELEQISRHNEAIKAAQESLSSDQLYEDVDGMHLLDFSLATPEMTDEEKKVYDESIKVGEEYVKERKKQAEDLKTGVENELIALNILLENTLVDSITGVVSALGSSASGDEIYKAFLAPIADGLGKFGQMLILQGVAIGAFKKSLATLNPAIAIAAGVSLVAISGAIKGHLSRMSGGGSSGASGYSGGASRLNSQSSISIPSTITVVAKGKDLQTVIDLQNRNDVRIRG